MLKSNRIVLALFNVSTGYRITILRVRVYSFLFRNYRHRNLKEPRAVFNYL